jgi:competence protein ComEC
MYGSNRIEKIKPVFGLSVYIISILFGLLTSFLHKENRNLNHYTKQINDYDKEYDLDLLLLEKLKSSKKYTRYLCQITKLDKKKSIGKVILNNNSNRNYNIGTHLKVKGTIFKNKKPSNPGLFDYSAYLENQEIYAQVYIFKNKIAIGKTEKNLLSYFSNFREKIILNLKKSVINEKELNVLLALILGQQQDISPEVLKDYQFAGAIHVLSVSGLHVGFILIFINFLMKPIGNSGRKTVLKLIILLLALWSFAVLAGLSPSIVRAVSMFSIMAIGNHMKRSVNIYHTLIVSMLLILLFKPSFLYDVGFQLSYLALFFIIWFQPLLSGIWKPKYKICVYFWDILTVSFAAQIGTMPLSIYYFHQFPGLFFITNLFIIPLLGIIMGVGIVVILIASFSVVPKFLTVTIEHLISFLNFIIHKIAAIDYFVVKNISFTKEMLWSSYLIILLAVILIKKPTFYKTVAVFMSIFLLQLIFIFQKKENRSSSELTIFNYKKNTLIIERIGKGVTIYCNDSIQKGLDSNLIIQSFLIEKFCSVSAVKPIQYTLYHKNKKILIMDSSAIYNKSISPDILIITQSPKLNMERLIKTIKPQQIVVDYSNYKSYTKLWKESCRKEKIPFHDTNEKGFYMY